MLTDSIPISFRVLLPGGSFRWTDKEPEGWTFPRGLVELRDPPWLLRDPNPDADTPPERERLVDRSSARLYRDFLSLTKHTRGPRVAFGDAVVRFASRYGFLGEPVMLRQFAEGAESIVGGGPQVESLRLWKRQIQNIYELDTLAELLRARDIDELRKRIKWDVERKEVRYVHVGNFRWVREPIATQTLHPDRYQRLQTAQAFDRSWTYFSSKINKGLAKSLLVLVPSDPKRVAVAHPCTLLDALYLRLYQKAANIDWERTCDWCDKPLLPDSTVRRRFCEGTQCRNYWHNRERGIKRAQANEGAQA